MLAVDYGRRRIGTAISDPTRILASPHEVVENADEPEIPPSALLRMIDEIEPALVLLGIPFEMDGSEGEMAREAREFGRNLHESTGVEIVEWDERLSTARARRALLESGASRRTRREKGNTDMAAAVVLLQAYLDADS